MQIFSTWMARLLLAASLLLASGLTLAQAEPTIGQIYATAQAGKLDDAQVMVQQVLVAHPNSAKAFFVQAELYARQGNPERARQSLATAEKIAPGLPFAKPEAVQALRAQLVARPAAKQAANAMAAAQSGYSTAAAPAAPSSSWLMPLLLAGGAIVAGYLFFRKRNPAQSFTQPGAVNGPQTFGQAGMPPQPYPQGGYAQGYPQPQGSGLGGRVAGGLATGLAVGAGVLAAQEIGRRMMGDHGSAAAAEPSGAAQYEPLSGNNDMGGNDFGIADTGSWDSGDAGGDAGGGGDW